MRQYRILAIICILVVSYLTGVEQVRGQNDLNGAENGAGWELLFNGKNMDGWNVKTPGSWIAEDGVITCKGRGDLYNDRKLGNFFLQVDFKVADGCNSGIYIRCADPAKRSDTSFEIQIIADYDRTPGYHTTGSIYDRMKPTAKAVKPHGEWNELLVLCLDNQIKIHLNDIQIIDADMNDWDRPFVNPDGTWNKFKVAMKYLPREGFLGFQSHGDDTGDNIWLRSIKVLELKD